jgi:hypothetical protein
MDERQSGPGADESTLTHESTLTRDGMTEASGEERDERAAAVARDRYRTSGLAPLCADADLAALLAPGERVFAVHPRVTALRTAGTGSAAASSAAGTLLLTSGRIIVAGAGVVEIDLEDIEEAVISGDRLLLVLGRGVGLSLALGQPRLLRVQVAAARSVTRGGGASTRSRSGR